MSMFTTLDICSSGMSAQRLRMDILAENMANIKSTRTSNGGPYVRKNVVFQEKTENSFASALRTAVGGSYPKSVGRGVKVTEIINDTSTPMNIVYEPSHPDADENGYVTYPNVDSVTEMTDLIDASRSYEGNITMFNAGKNMAMKGLEVGK